MGDRCLSVLYYHMNVKWIDDKKAIENGNVMTARESREVSKSALMMMTDVLSAYGNLTDGLV